MRASSFGGSVEVRHYPGWLVELTLIARFLTHQVSLCWLGYKSRFEQNRSKILASSSLCGQMDVSRDLASPLLDEQHCGRTHIHGELRETAQCERFPTPRRCSSSTYRM